MIKTAEQKLKNYLKDNGIGPVGLIGKVENKRGYLREMTEAFICIYLKGITTGLEMVMK